VSGNTLRKRFASYFFYLFKSIGLAKIYIFNGESRYYIGTFNNVLFTSLLTKNI